MNPCSVQGCTAPARPDLRACLPHYEAWAHNVIDRLQLRPQDPETPANTDEDAIRTHLLRGN